MVGPGAMDDTLESLQEQTHADWIAASLPQTSEPTGLQTEFAQEFLDEDGADCEFVVFALAGTLFAPSALQRIASAFAEFTNAQAVYADLDIQSDDGSVWPLAFPAFDYERMLEQGYCAHLFALRRDAAERASMPALQTSIACLIRFWMTDRRPIPILFIFPGRLATLPEFDKNGRSRGLGGRRDRTFAAQRHCGTSTAQPLQASFPAVHIKRKFDHPRTTIIIPTRNRKRLLQGCIESIRPAVEPTQAEILIVDNDSADPDTLDYLAELESRVATVLRVPGEFNFPRLNNYAAKAADAEILCLLNNDVKALDDRWLEEMLSRIADDDVGAVGALLVWPSGVVQHGGVVLGPSFCRRTCL